MIKRYNYYDCFTLNYILLPNSVGPTHFDAIELVNDRAAPRNNSKGGTKK